MASETKQSHGHGASGAAGAGSGRVGHDGGGSSAHSLEAAASRSLGSTRPTCPAVVAVDVGTGSVRAGVVDCSSGALLSKAVQTIRTWNPHPDHYEQATDDIWAAVCCCVKQAVASSGVSPSSIGGVGFDATCSLVAVDADDNPCSITMPTAGEPGGDGVATGVSGAEPVRNVVLWMDHRAEKEAEAINSTKHSVLQYVGGAISPEMELPKLLWLKRHHPECWEHAAQFFDLADWLTFRATGSSHRSVCTTTCKWTFLSHERVQASKSPEERPVPESRSSLSRESSPGADPAAEFVSESASESASGPAGNGWHAAFFRDIGLDDLVAEGYSRIGRPNTIQPVGSSVGEGLCPARASELGLPVGCAVASGLIDAHAGGIGTLGCAVVSRGLLHRSLGDAESSLDAVSGTATVDGPPPDMGARLALVAGTSTCHMALSAPEIHVPGVWGPFWEAMVPSYWLVEGGQSATGQLLDHIVFCHIGLADVAREAECDPADRPAVYAALNKRLLHLARVRGCSVSSLSSGLHVVPDFHGNRSPLADPTLRGMICGLSLASGPDELAVLYLATVQALSYGTKHLMDEFSSAGHNIQAIVACGGLAKNPLYVSEHANATGVPVYLASESTDAVLLGSGIAAAAAAGAYPSLEVAMGKMSTAESVYLPDSSLADFHARKYAVFRRMLADQVAYRQLMSC